MIKARHIPFYVQFFRWYSKWMLHRHFKEINIYNNVHDEGKPLLVIGNHFSWWDGFIVNYVNSLYFHRHFYFMMLEEQLSSRMFLNKAGGFSVKRGSRSMIESLEYSKKLMNDHRTILLIFPQGRIQTSYIRALSFEKGVERIISGNEEHIQIIFHCALIDYFSCKKPLLNIYLKEYKSNHKVSHNNIEKAYNAFYESCIDKQKEE
jgi:1-acyl-sn-glycerol-3-phosphate acyltransferase